MKRVALFFVFFVLVFPKAEAQFFKKLKQKAADAVERTVSNRAEREVEKSTDRVLDSVIDAPKNKKKSPDTSSSEEKKGMDMMQDILGGSSEVNWKAKYHFPILATMEVEDLTDRSPDLQYMIQGYGKDALYSEVEKQQIVIDMEHRTALIFNGNEASAMSLKWMEKMMGGASDENDNDNENVTIIKTGRTKTIAGYNCEEYKITYTDGSMDAWFTQEVQFEYRDYLQGFAKMFGKKMKKLSPKPLMNYDYGYVMEYIVYNKKRKKEGRMTVTNIENTGKTLELSNYTVTKAF